VTNNLPKVGNPSRQLILERLAQELLSGAGGDSGLPTTSGTAQRDKGKHTARRVIGAAITLLLGEDTYSFSLRAIAEAAGIKLANVQYYYPTKKALLQALFETLGHAYAEAYRLTHNDALAPSVALEQALAVQIHDARQQVTRRFFLRLWLLLEESDGFSGELLHDLYQHDIAPLTALVQAANTALCTQEAAQRATMIAATIEGSLIVVPGAQSTDPAFTSTMLKTCLRIAMADGHDA